MNGNKYVNFIKKTGTIKILWFKAFPSIEKISFKYLDYRIEKIE